MANHGGTKSSEHKRQKRLMKKRRKDSYRHRKRSGAVASENAVQHQMLGEFGNVGNFIRNVQHLASLFATDETLKKVRFDAKTLYDKIDATKPDMHTALEDIYSNDNFSYYAEEHEELWRKVRDEALPEVVTEDFVSELERTLKVLLQKKRGFKKDYRAVLAANLLLQSHVVAIKDSPIGENNLWEIIFNATLKENKIELPPVVEPDEDDGKESETPETETAGDEMPAEAEATKAEDTTAPEDSPAPSADAPAAVSESENDE